MQIDSGKNVENFLKRIWGGLCRFIDFTPALEIEIDHEFAIQRREIIFEDCLLHEGVKRLFRIFLQLRRNPFDGAA
jgi:hypothetical protein